MNRYLLGILATPREIRGIGVSGLLKIIQERTGESEGRALALLESVSFASDESGAALAIAASGLSPLEAQIARALTGAPLFDSEIEAQEVMDRAPGNARAVYAVAATRFGLTANQTSYMMAEVLKEMRVGRVPLASAAKFLGVSESLLSAAISDLSGML